jgi:hypothetical protein
MTTFQALPRKEIPRKTAKGAVERPKSILLMNNSLTGVCLNLSTLSQ